MNTLRDRLYNSRLFEWVAFYIALFVLYQVLPQPLQMLHGLISAAMLATIILVAYTCLLKIRR